MPNTKERLVTAQWVLERNLAWISAADVKVGVLATLDVAMFGGLAAAYALPKSQPDLAGWFGIGVACFMLLVALVMAFLVLQPNTKAAKAPSPHSLVFFGEISKMTCAEFTDALSTVTDEDLMKDWGRQIHRNAEIACVKHRLLRYAMRATFVALIPWTFAILKLVIKASTAP